MLRELVEHCKTQPPLGVYERRAVIDRSVEFFRSEAWGEFTIGVRMVLNELAVALERELDPDDERLEYVKKAQDELGHCARHVRKGVRDL